CPSARGHHVLNVRLAIAASIATSIGVSTSICASILCASCATFLPTRSRPPAPISVAHRTCRDALECQAACLESDVAACDALGDTLSQPEGAKLIAASAYQRACDLDDD